MKHSLNCRLVASGPRGKLVNSNGETGGQNLIPLTDTFV